MKKRGFTFLELLIAVTLFTVGMISVVQIFPVNRRLLTQSAQTTQASFLAQEQIEKVRNVAYEDLTVGNFEARAQVSTESNDPFSAYERQTVVSLVDGSMNASANDVGLKKVVVTVFWDERGVARQFSLSSLAYEN